MGTSSGTQFFEKSIFDFDWKIIRKHLVKYKKYWRTNECHHITNEKSYLYRFLTAHSEHINSTFNSKTASAAAATATAAPNAMMWFICKPFVGINNVFYGLGYKNHHAETTKTKNLMLKILNIHLFIFHSFIFFLSFLLCQLCQLSVYIKSNVSKPKCMRTQNGEKCTDNTQTHTALEKYFLCNLFPNSYKI